MSGAFVLLGPDWTGAVLELAREAGAVCVEAYPTRTADEPRAYRGSFRLYERAGFQEVLCEPDGDNDIVVVRRLL